MRKNREECLDHIILEDYPARPTPDYVKIQGRGPSALPAYRDAVGDGEEEQEEPEELDLDPRSGGKHQAHAILRKGCVLSMTSSRHCAI